MIHQKKLRFGTKSMESDLKKKIPQLKTKYFQCFWRKADTIEPLPNIVHNAEFNSNVPEEKRIKGKTLEGRPMGPACEGEPGCPISHCRPHRDLNLGHSSVSMKLSGWRECSIDNWGRNCPLQNEDKGVLRDYKCLYLALEERGHAPRTGNFHSTFPFRLSV